MQFDYKIEKSTPKSMPSVLMMPKGVYIYLTWAILDYMKASLS